MTLEDAPTLTKQVPRDPEHALLFHQGIDFPCAHHLAFGVRQVHPSSVLGFGGTARRWDAAGIEGHLASPREPPLSARKASGPLLPQEEARDLPGPAPAYGTEMIPSRTACPDDRSGSVSTFGDTSGKRGRRPCFWIKPKPHGKVRTRASLRP
jgi:hypothetical protein